MSLANESLTKILDNIVSYTDEKRNEHLQELLETIRLAPEPLAGNLDKIYRILEPLLRDNNTDIVVQTSHIIIEILKNLNAEAIPETIVLLPQIVKNVGSAQVSLYCMRN
jgi:predicted house-cleaning noncanonical NTP pyrophosphatase (MazG superfamily)